MQKIELFYDGIEVLIITDKEFDRIRARPGEGLPFEVERLIANTFGLNPERDEKV